MFLNRRLPPEPHRGNSQKNTQITMKNQTLDFLAQLGSIILGKIPDITFK
jgi:hypothetical protein